MRLSLIARNLVVWTAGKFNKLGDQINKVEMESKETQSRGISDDSCLL